MLKIMIVEDDLDLLHGLRFLLQAYNCKICPLSDADEIMKTAGLLQPDLILLDIKLDHGNGLDICRELKSSYLKNIPVYIMSGLPDAENKSYKAGADFFFAKPFDSEALLTQIGTLENSSSEEFRN
ncbi:MAG: response regulator [Bacteroidota bacterium]|nr:response regulator [Bacteroidota bacterium]MDP4212118.1 response regulator [Bacteroidota bacterium]MDP4249488.1 response regulator [Bacteroidota bacterium]